MAANRHWAYRKGRLAEFAAAWSLRAKGYRILAMRCRTPVGEIDLIARRGDLVAIVEVKARNSVCAALDAVTPTAMRRVQSAADLWLSGRRDAARLSIRFDIVAVVPWRWPVHFTDAF